MTDEELNRVVLLGKLPKAVDEGEVGLYPHFPSGDYVMLRGGPRRCVIPLYGEVRKVGVRNIAKFLRRGYYVRLQMPCR